MLTKIKQLLEENRSIADADVTEQPTDKLNKAIAALLVELVRADHVVDESEWRALEQVLSTRFELDASELQDYLNEARKSVQAATDLYQYTRLINAHFSYPDKCGLLEAMWLIAFADGRLDRYEEHLIRKIQGLIHVSHADFIQAKLKAREMTD